MYKAFASIFVLLTIGLGDSLPAHADEFACVSSVSSTGLIDKVQTAYAKVTALEATFTQESYLAALDISERAIGTVRYQRPGMMSWDYTQPPGQRFVVRGQTVWYYQPETTTLLIDSMSTVFSSELPVSFLLGTATLDKSFRLTRACRAANGTVLKLDPLEGSTLERMELRIAPTTFHPTGARVFDSQGNVTTILLSDLRYNIALQQTAFEVVPPEGTDIDDRREKNTSDSR